MTTEAEASVDGFEGGEEALCLLGVLKSLHLSFSNARRLMGVLASIVQVAALPVFYLRQNMSSRCSIAAEFVCDDDARSSSRGVQKLAEEAQRCPAVPLWLDQNVNGYAVLVHRSPQVVLNAIHLEKDLIQVPLRTKTRTPLSKLRSIEGTATELQSQ
jgi:hypothetical protein